MNKASWYFVVYLLARFEGQFEDLMREDTAREFKDGGLSGLSCLTQPDRPQLKIGSSLSKLRALVDTNFEFRALLVAMTTRKGPIAEKPLFFVDFPVTGPTQQPNPATRKQRESKLP